MHEDLVKRLIEIEMYFRTKEHDAQDKEEKRKYMEQSVTIGDAIYELTIPGWISVKYRLPDKSSLYLTLNHRNWCDLLMYVAEEKAWHSWGHRLADDEVSYWMPLPEPLEEVSGDE